MSRPTANKRSSSHKVVLTSLGVSAALAVTRPTVLGKVYAATNQYEWTKLNDLDRLGGFYSSAARSADGSSLMLAVYEGGEWQDGDELSPLYISNNSGATWENVADDIDPSVRNFWKTVDISDDGQVMVAVSDWGWNVDTNGFAPSSIYISEDGGDNWDDVTPDEDNYWDSIAVSGDGSKIATFQNWDGSIRVSENGGDSWSTVQPITGEDETWNIKSLSFSDDGETILVGGENGNDPTSKLFLSENGGDNWANITPVQPDYESHNISHDISADGSKIVASVMGWDGEADLDSVYISENAGDSWTEITPVQESENLNYWADSAISDDGSKIAILDNREGGKIYVSGDDGDNWSEEDPGQATEDSNAWVALDFNQTGSKVIVAAEDNAYITDAVLGSTTVTLDNAEDSKTIAINLPSGTTVTCHSAMKESALDPEDVTYRYPLGFVDFCFSGASEENEINLIFVTDLKPNEVTVRKYNPTTKKYATITTASVTETTYEGQHALSVTYTIVDNGELDTDPDVGEVADPVGLGVLDLGAPNTGIAPQDTGRAAKAALLTTATLAVGIAAAAPITRRFQARKSSSK